MGSLRNIKMFEFKDLGLGVDIEEIERFRKYDTQNNPFVLRIFTKNEIEYAKANGKKISYLENIK